jgi:CubicO group peptidase (beta-lactamase class C family)
VLDTAFSGVLEAAAARWEVPAVAVGVSLGGVEETAALGCAPETIFRVASITKPFTALLALGLLDLEAGTGGIWAPDVRVRHLLSHTSGYDCEVDDVSSLERVVEQLPGVRRWVGVEQVWSYSNAGYWLAGLLCAGASRASFEDALAARVLAPLGLEATSFGQADVPGTGPAAEGDGVYPRARRPSGGLVSNVSDLLRFGHALLREPRLRIVLGKPVGGVYGLGLQGERVGGVDVWGHGGSWGGYQSSLLTVPERDAVFVGLTNASYGSRALRRVEDAFFEHVVGAARAVPPTVTLPRPALDAFTGTYANSDGWYEVEALAARLRLTYDDGVFEARPIGERTFEILDGVRVQERLDFPREGFGRFGNRLAERVA